MRTLVIILALAVMVTAAPMNRKNLLEKLLEMVNGKEEKNIYGVATTSTSNSIQATLQGNMGWDRRGNWKIGLFYRKTGESGGTLVGGYKRWNNLPACKCLTIPGLQASTSYEVFTRVKFDNDNNQIESAVYKITTKERKSLTTEDLLEELLEAVNENEEKNIYGVAATSTSDSIKIPLQKSMSWDKQGAWKIGLYYRKTGESGGTAFGGYQRWEDLPDCKCLTIPGLASSTTYEVFTKVRFDNDPDNEIESSAFKITTKARKTVTDLKKEMKELLLELLDN